MESTGIVPGKYQENTEKIEKKYWASTFETQECMNKVFEKYQESK